MPQLPYHDAFLKILEEELLPAMGCTEPIPLPLRTRRSCLRASRTAVCLRSAATSSKTSKA